MLEAAVFALLIAFPLVGALARRWVSVIAPLMGWPIFYLGMNKGWWLYGTGDGWQTIATTMTFVGIAATALAVAGARALRPPSTARRLQRN